MKASTNYSNLAQQIIKQQETIVGPLAWAEAKKVSGLVVRDNTISIENGGKETLEKLVAQYATLFGQASIEACKDVVRKFAPDMDKNELPLVLSN